MNMSITVLGTDYEGLVISVGLAAMGHKVTAINTDINRVRRLQRGTGFTEDTELSHTMKLVLREGLLKFSSEPESCLAEADAVIISGMTGSDSESLTERTAILRIAECLSGAIASFSTVLVTAGVPTGSCRILQDWLNDAIHTGAAHVVTYPVFFSKPDGLHQFLNPERIVLGYENEHSRRTVDEIFANILMNDPPVCHVTWESAEMMRAEFGVIAASVPAEEKVYGRFSRVS